MTEAHLAAANVPPGTTPAPPADSGSVDPLVLGTAEDYQLARALDMLRGVALFNGRGKKLGHGGLEDSILPQLASVQSETYQPAHQPSDVPVHWCPETS